MNAETAGHAGTPQLKQFLMVNIDMWRHPKYYKELRKLRNKLDQAISLRAHDGECERSPGPGLKPQAPSDKHQAASHKRQASSSKLVE
jgi:hypothetical protein